MAVVASPGRPGEPLHVLSIVPQPLVHDGVVDGSGGDLLLEQGWSQLGLKLDFLGENWWSGGGKVDLKLGLQVASHSGEG